MKIWSSTSRFRSTVGYHIFRQMHIIVLGKIFCELSDICSNIHSMDILELAEGYFTGNKFLCCKKPVILRRLSFKPTKIEFDVQKHSWKICFDSQLSKVLRWDQEEGYHRVGLPQRLVPLWASRISQKESQDATKSSGGRGWMGRRCHIISNFRGTWFMNSVHVT